MDLPRQTRNKKSHKVSLVAMLEPFIAFYLHPLTQSPATGPNDSGYSHSYRG